MRYGALASTSRFTVSHSSERVLCRTTRVSGSASVRTSPISHGAPRSCASPKMSRCICIGTALSMRSLNALRTQASMVSVPPVFIVSSTSRVRRMAGPGADWTPEALAIGAEAAMIARTQWAMRFRAVMTPRSRLRRMEQTPRGYRRK